MENLLDKINPKSQKEADLIYEELSYRMCDEVIYQDGEASHDEAKDTFLYFLEIAKQVEACGFKPTIESDVFYPKGHIPSGWGE